MAKIVFPSMGTAGTARPVQAPVRLPAPPVESPCINICRMDPVSGLCEGCARTLDEIAAWSRLDDGAKRMVLDQLPARRAAADPFGAFPEGTAP